MHETRRLRSRTATLACGLAAAAGLAGTLEAGPAAPAPQGRSAARVTVVSVIAGKPSELRFKLSRLSLLPAGKIVFKVTNAGVAFHDFKLCTAPTATAARNACVGRSTRILKHGQAATLAVTLTRKGTYEFLCTVAGHAAAGMKGLLGVGVKVPASATIAASAAPKPTSQTSTAPAATTPAPPTTTTVPAPTVGGGNTSGCPPGVTIRTSGNADADGDELGTEPDDQDGCV